MIYVNYESRDKIEDIMKELMGTVTSDSMAPLIEVGVVVKVLRKTNYPVGTLLLFKTEKELVVHRLIRKENDFLVTKGDNSWENDAPLEFKDVLGQIATIYDERMRVISLPSKREKLFFIIDSFLFQYGLMKYRKFRWFRYYVLRFFKRIMWSLR